MEKYFGPPENVFDPNPSSSEVCRPRLRSRCLSLWQSLALATVLGLSLTPVAAFPELLQADNTSSQSARRATAPAFVIRLKDGQATFRQGETIAVELGADRRALANRLPVNQDAPGLAALDLALEPKDEVVDPMRDFLATVGVWCGPPARTLPFIQEHGDWARVDLNEWFRFDKPGKYRLYVTAYPVRNRFEGFEARESGVGAVRSNTLEFEIVAADPSWQAAELQKALALLESGKELEGCRMLRFLTSRGAVNELAKHYDDQSLCTAQYRYGLFAFPDRSYVIKQMENGIVAPTQPISADYIDTLARLAIYSDYGGLVSEMATEEDRFAQDLVSNLPNKIGRARALSLKGIFDSPFLGRPTLLKSTDPALTETLRKALAEVFVDLPTDAQSSLLWFRWPNIASPAMVPVLERLYTNPPPGTYEPQFVGMVLQRLYEVSPSEGRALILEEMKRPDPRFDLRFLPLLPDKEIPELDGPLIENLEASNGESDTSLELIGRYATGSIFPRVIAIEEGRIGRMSCEAQSALLQYAFRVDAGSGAEMLRKALSARKETGCYKTVLGEVAQRHMSSEIEQIALARLEDSDLEVAAGAVGTLGHYGSEQAEQPLWDRLEKWHTSWAGRVRELPNGFGSALRNGLDTGLELALIEALGSGQAWFAGPKQLGRLSSLCVSRGGCQRVEEMIRDYSDTPIINVSINSEGRCFASVNQYRQLNSLLSLKQKLAQFPESTALRWAFDGVARDGAQALAEIRAFLKDHGMTIQ